MQLVHSEAFTADRLQDGRRVRLRAEVELLAGPMIADAADHAHDRLILDRPPDALEPGFHRVVMSAWWPGVEARARAAAVVELSCNDPTP